MKEQLTTGAASPPGSRYDGKGVNFSLFSAHAQWVELCLFSDSGEETRLVLPARSGNYWHGYLPGGQPGLLYGFRVYGPWAPERGLRFNPHKLLLDPYARAISGSVADSPLLTDGGPEPDERDSAGVAPKAVVVADAEFDWFDYQPPRTPWAETIIYEAHVRGLTINHPQVPRELRGSYAALAHPAILSYLTQLGITAIELMPVQCHVSEPRLQRMGLSNYWGYNVLAPFAVANDYWSGRPGTTAAQELKEAVRALHSAGIEVILDVVFNHTAELDFEGDGPTLSLRAIDNPSYYWLDDAGNYLNWSGCGNLLRFDRAETLRWVLDCLRYWVSEFHIDGFRFDLGAQLGRTPQFSPHSPLFCALLQDPLLAECKLIAEPWDLGPDGYQLGRFPAPFAEWNDYFRDHIRRFWLRGDVTLGEFAHAFSASSRYFQHDGRLPYATINLITAHDGFTLRDLVSFNNKHNQANGENNRDGHSENFSNNHGIEGFTPDETIHQRRLGSQRALLMTLLLSRGTPQLLAGDESGHTQNGNNNSYCQDNALTWLDWLDGDPELLKFSKSLMAVRKQIPALKEVDWWQPGAESVLWLDANATPVTDSLWQQLPAPPLQIVLSRYWLLLINNSAQQLDITLPGGQWKRCITSVPQCPAPVTSETQWPMAPHSITLLQQSDSAN
ncbi:MAG: glycogen debranching protein GlgX [Enterobacteriaceae bacterium]